MPWHVPVLKEKVYRSIWKVHIVAYCWQLMKINIKCWQSRLPTRIHSIYRVRGYVIIKWNFGVLFTICWSRITRYVRVFPYLDSPSRDSLLKTVAASKLISRFLIGEKLIRYPRRIKIMGNRNYLFFKIFFIQFLLLMAMI